MAKVLTMDNQPSVYVEAGELVIDNLREKDPEVVRVFEEADDPEALTHRCLAVGARAVGAAGVHMDTDLVDKAFAGFRADLDGKLEETVGRVEGVARSLLDEEEGALTITLSTLRSELEGLLAQTFDPDSTKSVIGAIDALLERARRDHSKAIHEALDLGSEASPLRRVVRDVGDLVKEQIGEVKSLVAEVGERVAVETAKSAIYELTTQKGFAFEDLVHEYVSEIAAIYGDCAEQTGGSPGTTGKKKGDEVVTVNPDDVRGLDARFVLESKDGKDEWGPAKATAELTAAMENRQATIAILVVSSQEQAPSAQPFHILGTDKAYVVVDKHDPNPLALRLGYTWARWEVRRRLTDGGDLDHAKIHDLVERGRRALEARDKTKACLAQGIRKIESADALVDGLALEVEEILATLAAMIDGA